LRVGCASIDRLAPLAPAVAHPRTDRSVSSSLSCLPAWDTFAFPLVCVEWSLPSLRAGAMNLLSHTPPAYGVGSLEPPKMKRPRSGSISNRLRSASVLCEESNLDKDTKGALKDLIIRDDPSLQPLMKRIEDGDPSVLREMIDSGTLRLGRQHMDDLLGEDGDLNLDFLNVGDVDVGSVTSDRHGDPFLGEEEDGGGQFEFSFNDDADDFAPGALHAPAPIPFKQDPSSRSRRNNSSLSSLSSSRPGPLITPDVKPIPVNGASNRDRSISFGAPLMEVFGMDIFDDPSAPQVPYSPMSHSPSRSMGSVGSSAMHGGVAGSSGSNLLARPGSNLSTSNLLNRPLHRDSIGCVEDILANTGSGRAPNSYGSAGFPGFDALDGADMMGDGNEPRLSSLSSLSSFGAMRNNGRSARTRSGGIATLPNQPHQSQYDTRNRGTRVPLRHQDSSEDASPGSAQSKSRNSKPKVSKPQQAKPSKPKPTVKPVQHQQTPQQQQTYQQYQHAAPQAQVHSRQQPPIQQPQAQQQQQQAHQAHQHHSVRGGQPPLHPRSTTNDHKTSAPVPIEQPPAFVYKPDPANINQTGHIGGYSPDSRRRRIEKFLQKRQNRVWMKKVKYDVRKNFADSRLRVKGRFVRKEDEQMLRELVAMTL